MCNTFAIVGQILIWCYTPVDHGEVGVCFVWVVRFSFDIVTFAFCVNLGLGSGLLCQFTDLCQLGLDLSREDY